MDGAVEGSRYGPLDEVRPVLVLGEEILGEVAIAPGLLEVPLSQTLRPA
jgi:hypothetical protein